VSSTDGALSSSDHQGATAPLCAIIKFLKEITCRMFTEGSLKSPTLVIAAH
jgi:hypothetical protein